MNLLMDFRIIKTIREMQAVSEDLRMQNKKIGFVPTMGYLHEGHLALIRRAKEKADIVVTSIYVNPTQFDPNEDFNRYPRDFNRDLVLAQKAGTNILFSPTNEEMYPAGFQTHVRVEELTKGLCGISRPGHFQGVTTVVCKLFNIVKPHVAIFGQKDYQQARAIQQMVLDLNFDIKIDVAPIVREKNGLAMSSRNEYLTPEERVEAIVLHESLELAKGMIILGERNSECVKDAMRELIEGVKSSRIDYIEIVDPVHLEPVEEIKSLIVVLLAVYIGKTRLIDNMFVNLNSKQDS